jgi:hypothetical protein
MRQFILRTLNEHFLPVNLVDVSLFPNDEFNESEAISLKGFCEVLHKKGYDELFKKEDNPGLRDTLSLAADYGTFVKKHASPWYLGIFIAAECIMDSSAHESFFDPMLRSEVFAVASSEWKNLALWLMLMALFCNQPSTTPMRVESYIDSCYKLGYDLRQLSVETICNVKRPI